MSDLDPELFAAPSTRDSRFEVVHVWSEMDNVWDDDGKMVVEFMHRQMNEEIDGLEIAARNLSDYPDAPWELRLAIARQCWDEARHVLAFRRCFERRGGAVGDHPVLNFEYRMITAIPTLIGRLAVQNRSFEAAGIQELGEVLAKATDSQEDDLMILFDAQLADEIQHVRYANVWIEELVRRDPRQALDIVRAVAQANRAFKTIAGEAAREVVLGNELKQEAGFIERANVV